MKKLEMTDLQTNGTVRGEERTLFVPGGWQAIVPEVTPDAAALRAFTRYLLNEGLTEWKAEQEALATIQSVFESGYVRGIRNMLYLRAREYAGRYPDCVADDGTLLGFDPATLQSAYFPYENTGRRGKSFVDTAMRKMAENCEEAEDE